MPVDGLQDADVSGRRYAVIDTRSTLNSGRMKQHSRKRKSNIIIFLFCLLHMYKSYPQAAPYVVVFYIMFFMFLGGGASLGMMRFAEIEM